VVTVSGPSADLRARREARIAEHVEAENRFDVDAVLATMQQEPTYHVVSYGVKITGHDNCREFLLGHFASLPGIHTTATRFYHSEDATVVETHTTGTHTGEIAGIPANGNKIDVTAIGIFFFEPDGDVILAEKVFSDMLSLVNQLKGEEPAAIAG
jgi:steroid delta-isomerase-like uncharacterized protein